MGQKGSKSRNASTNSAEGLLQTLSSLSDIRLRKMFGGHGIFETDKMFALVDSEGSIFFKVDETNLSFYEEAGSSKHNRMPYYRVPDKVLADEDSLLDWARASIKVSRDIK